MTRAQMTTFIANLVDYVDPTSLPAASGSSPYGDVADSDTHAGSIRRLTAAGIVQGVGGGSFAPSQPVTRAQMATFITNAQDFVDGDGSGFPASDDNFFVDDDGNTHEDNIDAITRAGIAQGTGQSSTGDLYSPDASIRRDQMATFLARQLDYNVAAPRADTLPPPGIVVSGPTAVTRGNDVSLTIEADRGGIVESATIRGCGIDPASAAANPNPGNAPSITVTPSIPPSHAVAECPLTVVTTFMRGAPHPLPTRTETDTLRITVNA